MSMHRFRNALSIRMLLIYRSALFDSLTYAVIIKRVYWFCRVFDARREIFARRQSRKLCKVAKIFLEVVGVQYKRVCMCV